METKKRSKTRLMRAPVSFCNLATALSKKYGYKKTTKFLEKDGVRIFQNADYLNDKIINKFKNIFSIGK